MNKFNKMFVTIIIMLLISFASFSATIGNLTYGQETNIITDNVTGIRYLVNRLDAPNYGAFHVATQMDAYAFFNAYSGPLSQDKISLSLSCTFDFTCN